MRKFLIILFLLPTALFYSQNLKDIEVLYKIKGVDIKTVPKILNLKPTPESKTSLGLTSSYFKKGNFTYTASEDIDNDKADRVYVSFQGKNVNEKWLELCKEFENDKSYKLLNYKYEMGRERETFLTLAEIITHMQKWDVLNDKAIVYGNFERNNQVYEIQCVYDKVLFAKLK